MTTGSQCASRSAPARESSCPAQRRRRLRRLCAVTLAAVASLAAGVAGAQTAAWPSKPLKIVVTYPTGGTTDAAARQLAERLAPVLGQPVLVENRAGASGSIGMDAVAKSAPDGHTIAFAAISPVTLNPHVMKVPYDAMKDIAPLARVMFSPVYVLATPAFTGKTFDDAIAQARARPGRVNLATSGIATVGHLMLEAIRRRAQVDINHVPYKGGGQVLTDAVGGQFELLTSNPSPTLNAMIAQGKLRVLAVAAPSRLPALPDTPTLAELGYPGANLTSVFGLFAPAKTPPEVMKRLNAEINRIVQSRDMTERLEKLDNVVSTGTVEQFAAQVAAEFDANARIVREAGIRAE